MNFKYFSRIKTKKKLEIRIPENLENNYNIVIPKGGNTGKANIQGCFEGGERLVTRVNPTKAFEIFFGEFLGTLRVGELFDVQSVSGIGGHASRRCVRLKNQSFVFQKCHVIADGGRAHVQPLRRPRDNC